MVLQYQNRRIWERGLVRTDLISGLMKICMWLCMNVTLRVLSLFESSLSSCFTNSYLELNFDVFQSFLCELERVQKLRLQCVNTRHFVHTT